MSRGRILIVDDVPDWRTTLSGILLDEGYEVCTAEGRDEALRLLEAERFHLAVIDVRLDESDEENREGLELMRQIKTKDPTMSVIILTGYADVDMVQEARRPQSNGVALAYSFVEKPHSQELTADVKKAFQSEIKINWHLVIHADSHYLHELPARFGFTDGSKENKLRTEVKDLLRKLFFNCNEITLHPLGEGYSEAAVFRVEPYYPQRGKGESVVAKIGPLPLIELEERNFEQEVQGIVGGYRLPQRLESARTRFLGGLVYSFAGLGRAESFTEFYAKAAPSEIAPVLQNLFLDTCFPWRRRNTFRQHRFNFVEHFFSHFDLNPAKLRQAVARLLDGETDLSPLDDAGSKLRFLEDTTLINPVEFVVDHPMVGDTYLTLVHGDITGNNVLLDHRLETWLIDFAKTGQGPLLQDFVSLENFIKFSLLECDDPRSIFEWEQELVNSPTLQPSPRLLEMTPPDRLSRAHQTILAIRTLACQVSGDEHLREYLIGLLFHALKWITFKDLKPIQRGMALVSAALICERLVADSPD